MTTAAVAVPLGARRARAAVAAVFLTNGALFANVVPRYPEVKEHLDLSNALFGTALAAGPLGALTGGLFAPLAIRVLGSARTASFGIPLIATAFLLVAVAPSWWLLAVVLFCSGAADAVVDVAQNAHGLRVQRIYGRSIVNSFHGVWSIGAVLGGLMGSAAAGLHVPLLIHLVVAGVLFSIVALAAYRYLLRGPDEAERPAAAAGRSFARAAVWMLAALGLLALFGALVEDAGASWGALFMTEDIGATAAVAGLAFVALQVAMTAGRLLGDRLVDRFGQRTVTRIGGAVAAAGMGFALAFPSVGSALVGFALAGLGTATLVPAAMHTADELPGLPSGLGLTVVSWVLRIGFLASPPLVGLVADHSSLRVGLLSVVIAGVGTLLLGRVLLNRRTG
ncbi:MFS transporter [Winogradskya consettensis]|uniref:MFS transporter n=1 Tax=Winogradskya consettensis TaxID=113560 RepID=A0A919VVV7_9ACTN|nr:MFS transporter [Actinoplanes consettensis]GIM81046.1 MFS transporter [Actinoplanes consettensis]